jgi:hypothetical protein
LVVAIGLESLDRHASGELAGAAAGPRRYVVTAADACDVTLRLSKPAFETVSITRSLFPTSAATGVYVFVVAPEMFVQLARVVLVQRIHW